MFISIFVDDNTPIIHTLVPTLTVEMQPPTGIALDIPPYNTFTLRCAANAPENVLLQKSFEWRNGGTVISDNGNTVLISHRNINMPQSISELTVNDLSVGSHTYFCTVSMSVPGGVDIAVHASGVVNVKGRNCNMITGHLNYHYCRSKCTCTTS